MTPTPVAHEQPVSEMFRLNAAEWRMLEKLRGRDAISQSEGAEVLARAAWARISEPGDRIAVALVTALGPVGALESLVSNTPVERIVASVQMRLPESGLNARELHDGMTRWTPRLHRESTLNDIRVSNEKGVTVIVPGDAQWPVQVDDLGEHAPHLFWVRGNPELLRTASLAVVGARASSAYGEHVTAELTDLAVQRGLTIVSGAAYGIDAVAHRTALARNGMTIAVLAGGVDRNYPAAHTSLLEQIASTGAVCSEVVPGTAPTRWRFLQRNRIISALAAAVLVTEAGTRSGSLNTAGHASQLGRALGAVPGPITSVGSHGCFTLIREYDAMLVANDADLGALVGSDTLFEIERTERDREPAVHMRVRDALPLRGACDAEQIARRAGLSTQEAVSALVEMELLRTVVRSSPRGSVPPTWSLP